jgi:lipopolysaccharide/colanic/teichoic acid biosynthesis glycosyltransferase
MPAHANSPSHARDRSPRPLHGFEYPRQVVDDSLNTQELLFGGYGREAADAIEVDLLAGGLLDAGKVALLAKRMLDVVGATLALLMLLPVLLVTALTVRLTSKGPIFYVQERIGRGERPFRMIKFRSMYQNAHAYKLTYLSVNEAGGPVFKMRKDPRITPVGRLIRKLSIDELPQLFNVLRGEMSLVGPRPPLPEEYKTYGQRERHRMLVTPGLTCIWQVSGRSTVTDFDRWVDLDLEYIRTWTFWVDIALLLRTVPAVLSTRGAW